MARLIWRFLPLIVLLTFIWAVEAVNYLVDHRLATYGIQPRTATGLRGIALAPFLHFSVAHLMSNTVPLGVLGGLTLTSARRRRFVAVTAIVIGFGYGLTWAFARGSDQVHAGASGLVFGYFGYLVFHGMLERSVISVLVSLLTVLLYGYYFYGLLSFDFAVSFEGHLFAFVAGVAAAWALARRPAAAYGEPLPSRHRSAR